MAYSYPAMVAWDPGSSAVVKNSQFLVYTTTDTSFASPLPITDNFGNALANLNSGVQGVFPSFQQAQYATVVVSDTPNHRYAWTVPAAASNTVLQWQPNTYYAAGQTVADPNGNIVTATVAHTSASTFTSDASNWSTPAAGTAAALAIVFGG